MNNHWHESYDIYGLDGIRQDAREALALVGGLREDLGYAEERIRDLQEQITALRTALETAIDDAVRAHSENEPHIYADGSTS